MLAVRGKFAPSLRIVSLLLLLIWGGRGADARVAEWDAAGPAVAITADLSQESGRTRLTIALSRPVEAASFLLEKPDRVIVDLPEVNFQLSPMGARHLGLVKSLRCGLIGPGRSRIVVELTGPAVPVRTETLTGPDGVARLIVELARSDREAFRRAVQTGARDTQVRVTGAIETAAKEMRPLIALDAGHGGVDPGARAVSGEAEKDIVLAFAERLRATLAGSGRYRVVMTRDHDVFVPLDERVRRARAAGADLFVSIHADSISSPTVRGATIYTGAEQATDVESQTLAERENSADAAGGLAHGPEPAGVSDILQDLTMRETRGFSHGFARHLFSELNPMVRFSTQPHREAGFRVLRAADMPSVLLELGYLSNARDVESLLSEDWRRRTSAAMANAIDRFFALRLAGGTAAAVSP
jgi:N-acetylmuramoyl-L-alanine amidase